MSRALLILSLAFALAARSFGQAATSLNLSTDLVTLGIASTNMAPNQPTQDSTVLLESAVKYLRSHTNITSVTVNPGAYYFLSVSTAASFCNAAINALTPTNGLTFDFQGSDFYSNHPEKDALGVLSCSNVTVQNFTVDELQPLYTQVQITAVNAATRQIQYATMAGYQTPTALEALNPAIDTNSNPSTGVFIFRNGAPLPNTTRMSVATPYAYTDTALTFATSESTAEVGLIQPGDVGVINSRGNTGGIALFAATCTGCTFRGIKIYGGGVAFRSQGLNSCLIERVEVMPRPNTTRLVSVIAGGIVPALVQANNTIRLCRVIRNCDDGFAPNSFIFGQVASAASGTSLQISGVANSMLGSGVALPNGAAVTFQQTDGTIVASATVQSSASVAAVNGLPQTVLTFTAPVSASLVGTLVYPTDPAARGGMLLERNAVEQDAWGHAYAIYGVINTNFIGNYGYHIAWSGVQLINDIPPIGADWMTPPPDNFTASHNVFDGLEMLPTPSQVYSMLGGFVSAQRNSANGQPFPSSPVKNTFYTGNFVANPGASGLWIGNTTGAVADENYLLNANNNPPLNDAYAPFKPQMLQPIVLQNSSSVTLGMNLVDNASGQVFVTDTGYAQLAAYKPGTTIRLSALGLGNLGSPQGTVTDADGTVTPLTVTASASNSLDVVLPASTGLGGAYVTVTAGGQTYFGTLFVDSQDNVPQVNQATFQIEPVPGTLPAAGGTVSLLVVTQPGTAVTVTDPDSFVTPGAGITGTGVVTVRLAANAGAADRSTTVAVAGQSVTINQAGTADPVISSQPSSQTIANGASGTLTVKATGASAYQWYLNGVAISGATSASLNLSNVTPANAGTYTVVATAANGTSVASSAAALVSVTNVPAVAHLSNLSIGTNLSSAATAFTIGTVVGGTGTAGVKPMLFRADGPTLGQAPFGIPNVVATPTLTVYSGQTIIAANAGWGGAGDLSEAFNALGAFPFTSATSLDSAVYLSGIASGAYTVQVSSTNSAQGFVIAEMYDGTPSAQFTALTPRLINISVGKTVVAGETFTAGFFVGGSAPEQVLIRADGPTLGQAPFNLPSVMADPQITVYTSGGTVVGTNDNWGTPVGAGAASVAQLNAAFAQVGAFTLTSGSKDAAVLLTLPPGGYSAVVTGVNGSAGYMIVEVYEVPSS